MKTIINSLKIVSYFIVLLVIGYSCTNKNDKNKQYNLSVRSLNVTNNTEFDANNFIKNISYIKLSTTDPNSLFTEISKIEIKNNLIYVLDACGQHYVYIFNMDGSFVQRIGKKGNGPGEYIRLCDFDVDEKGNIYLCDRRKKRIIIYDNHNKLISDKRMPFRADAFNLLNEGNYIFSVQFDSSKPEKKSKVIITDSSFNIKRRYFTYDKNCLDDKRSDNIFRENKYGILYNKPVNDTIYEFSKTGELIKALYFDFGRKTVPQSLKNSYGKLIIERKKMDFKYFNQPPLLIKNYVMGSLIIGKTKVFMLYDLKNNKTFQHEISEDKFTLQNINFPLNVLNDSVVISSFDMQLFQYSSNKSDFSSDIQNHIKNGGTVLSFYTLK